MRVEPCLFLCVLMPSTVSAYSQSIQAHSEGCTKLRSVFDVFQS